MNEITGAASAAPLTADQQSALKKLHEAATQLEGVFVGMLFKAMHEGDPQDSITGKVTNAEQTWNEMLDDKRADAMAQTGQLGIAKMIENQLRASVIGSTGNTPPAPAAPAARIAAPAAASAEELP
jgi:Rod binding domain-containing protein